MDLRYLAKLDSLCRAYITNRKIELQLQSYKGSLKYHMRPLLESLSSVELQTINHPAADKMEVVCVPQRDLLKICAYHYHEKTPNKTNSNNQQQANQQANQQQQQQPPQNDKINEPIAWIEKILPHMTNDVMIRSSGWWDCGKSECYVVIQDKFEWNHINLQNSEIGGKFYI
jgi:uncharacterized FlaG/YvyC family protein